MAGSTKEGDSILEGTQPGAVRDAGIIASSQKIEHYEIATYALYLLLQKHLRKMMLQNYHKRWLKKRSGLFTQ
jgi:ferritin-like metal-binding protein YciE